VASLLIRSGAEGAEKSVGAGRLIRQDHLARWWRWCAQPVRSATAIQGRRLTDSGGACCLRVMQRARRLRRAGLHTYSNNVNLRELFK
jgi:hypothetical protein